VLSRSFGGWQEQTPQRREGNKGGRRKTSWLRILCPITADRDLLMDLRVDEQILSRSAEMTSSSQQKAMASLPIFD
jgi:hypothetical protein